MRHRRSWPTWGGTLSEVDPRANRVVRLVRVGGSPLALAATPTRVLVGTGTRVVHVNAGDGRVIARSEVGARVVDLALAAGAVWVGMEGVARPRRL